jgi:MoaA/NifB/PqqE/SkfB family radical SAM enzyme
MIAFSKLLCGHAAAFEVMREQASERPAPEMHPFFATERPLVVWNATCRCNLNCSHCHIDASDRCAGDELTADEAHAMIDDLAAMQVPVLLLSGGEPLMRKDVLDLARYASGKGLHPVLSTNGTLIDRQVAERIRGAGVCYAGISIDGLEATHNLFRGNPRAFQDAIEGLFNSNKAGVKTGIRFTLNALSYHDLPGVLDLAEELKVPRFCMYNMACSGPESALQNQDVTPDERRNAVNFIIEKAMDWDRRGVQMEITTTDYHADGAYVHSYITRTQPDHAGDVRSLLEMSGGCSAGCKISNVDPVGNVRACQRWGHVILGNVRKRKFSEIWRNTNSALLEQLRREPALFQGKFAPCIHNEVCRGRRICADAASGDVRARAPDCCLTEEERRCLAPERA